MKLLIGASGLLGNHLCLNSEMCTPTHSELNIANFDNCFNYFSNKKLDLEEIIIAAAYTNVAASNKNMHQCYSTNVVGVSNIVWIAQQLFKSKPKITYISTDYVFSGEKGNYKTSDPIDPVPNNYYALTKALGESKVEIYAKHLIIRTSFCRSDCWPYEKAFSDQYTSRDTIDVIAPKIGFLIDSNVYGIQHVGTERKSVYELAKRLRSNVLPCSRLDIKDVYIPYDTSLELTC